MNEIEFQLSEMIIAKEKLAQQKEIMITALKKIAQPEGAYSQDTETYLKNIIETSIEVAQAAIKDVEDEYKE